MTYREAALKDLPQMYTLRNLVKENVLSDPGWVTKKAYETFLKDPGKGWVCELEDHIKL